MPVHFLDLASAVEKLRWAEKEWRELDQDVSRAETDSSDEAEENDPEIEQSPDQQLVEARPG